MAEAGFKTKVDQDSSKGNAMNLERTNYLEHFRRHPFFNCIESSYGLISHRIHRHV